MFPISLWIPQEYPRAAPIVFVTPAKNMAVRPGQYVSAEGRVYHPFMAGWRETVSCKRQVVYIDTPIRARNAASNSYNFQSMTKMSSV